MALVLPGATPDNIVDVVASDSRRRNLQASGARPGAGAAVSYTVAGLNGNGVASNASAVYAAASNQLAAAVSSGNFTSILRMQAMNAGASGLLNSTVPQIDLFGIVPNPTTPPTPEPSPEPSTEPTPQPTRPTAMPSPRPTANPTARPTTRPTASPSAEPTQLPTPEPTFSPTTAAPTEAPIADPTEYPTAEPTSHPIANPTARPSTGPTACPSTRPTAHPSTNPSAVPTTNPSAQPTPNPTVVPTTSPSTYPTTDPTNIPSTQPTSVPTATPTCYPTTIPTANPSAQPTTNPTVVPTKRPSTPPTTRPTNVPSAQPTSTPTTSYSYLVESTFSSWIPCTDYPDQLYIRPLNTCVSFPNGSLIMSISQEGSLPPMHLTETWFRRRSDCQGQTVLLNYSLSAACASTPGQSTVASIAQGAPAYSFPQAPYLVTR